MAYNNQLDGKSKLHRDRTGLAWRQIQELHHQRAYGASGSHADTKESFVLNSAPDHFAFAIDIGRPRTDDDFRKLVSNVALPKVFTQWYVFCPTDSKAWYSLAGMHRSNGRPMFAFLWSTGDVQKDDARTFALADHLHSQWKFSDTTWDGRRGFLIQPQMRARGRRFIILKSFSQGGEKTGFVVPVDFGIVARTDIFKMILARTKAMRAVVPRKDGSLEGLGSWHGDDCDADTLSTVVFIKPGAKDRFTEWAATNPQIKTEVVDLNDQ